MQLDAFFFFLPVKSLKSMQLKHILETQFFALIYFCCLLEILSTVLIPELQQRAPTCGRASHCQVTVVRDLASGCSLHNPYQMVLSAPDHKNASLLPPHRRPEPGWRMKFNTRRSTNTSNTSLPLFRRTAALLQVSSSVPCSASATSSTTRSRPCSCSAPSGQVLVSGRHIAGACMQRGRARFFFLKKEANYCMWLESGSVCLPGRLLTPPV